MRYLLGILLLFTSVTDPVTKIAKSNKLKKQASQAYNEGDYESAITAYQLLLDSLDVDDNKARLNLANAAYIMSYGGENMGLLSGISSGETMVEDTAALNAISGELKFFDIAESNYKRVKDSGDKRLASLAHNQLGVISYKMGEQSPDEKESFTQSALTNFKKALLNNPQNDQARYNYELLKKLIRQQEQQEQDQKDQNKDQEKKDDKDQKDQEKQDQDKQDQEKKDQEKKDQENKDQEEQENQEQKKDDKEGEENEEQKEGEQKEDPLEKLKEKLKEMNIPLEKAQMILEAMKNNETQYVQQKKRKATQRKDNSKPDW
ncbi:hypothetical protein [Roseivirga misakiensis]|uniref:Uncharacterized protein n=1 Tax=Roseivirga misakiensis TaxID=1563681 RepID=A0A1E5T198_9BACT|nr:hypothetical protein [Roseivirga misakiensis]OEK05153.1 hypothetical protein BFP71_17230 [Roseivirga misakiensis]